MTAVLPQGPGQDEDTTDLWTILFRRQQLQNRLQFLQEIQKKNNKIEGKEKLFRKDDDDDEEVSDL